MKLLRAVAAWLWLGAVLAAEPEQPAQDLQDLRHKIEALKQELQANEATRHEAADALKDSERAISDANRLLEQLDRDQAQARTDRAQTEKRIATLRDRLAGSRAQLRTLLRARYRHGDQQMLQILLNRQEPGQLARDLHYFRYIAAAQNDVRQQLVKQVGELDSLAARLKAKEQELDQLTAEKKRQRDLLQAEQNQRQRVLSQLAAEIGQQRREIGRLEQDEKRLTRLVESLDRLMRRREAKAAQERERLARLERQKAREAARAKPEKSTNKPAVGPDRPATPATEPAKAEPVQPAVTPESTPTPERPTAEPNFAALKGKLKLPLRGEVIGRFGAQRQEGASWKGIFIRASGGQPVKAVASGQVVFADWLRGFGNMLIVDHGGGYMSLYGAAESLLRQVGDKVRAGDEVATSGNSGGGGETGVYFEIRHQSRPVDPMVWAR
ncbi:murein hydrolase activator EnvC family protein [Chitinimonas lacunae]|uniref:Peptidoglycan DD-metalloendopeptidase family protein n=1 Tax=Chitinimonas lacunae TaxID=1963018 RepID=A0ABV8MKP4_9NEIS